MDNHSTNKSNCVLAFLYHLVLIGWFDVIELLFFIAYEGKSRADQDHSAIDKILAHENIFSPEDFERILLQHGKECMWLRAVRNWEAFFAEFINDFPV